MVGIQASSQALAATRPPFVPPAALGEVQTASWPSLQTLGVMKLNDGVVEMDEKFFTKGLLGEGFPFVPMVPSGRTLALHSAELSITEWNQTKGSCRVT
jgi:hypothetical protein